MASAGPSHGRLRAQLPRALRRLRQQLPAARHVREQRASVPRPRPGLRRRPGTDLRLPLHRERRGSARPRHRRHARLCGARPGLGAVAARAAREMARRRRREDAPVACDRAGRRGGRGDHPGGDVRRRVRHEGAGRHARRAGRAHERAPPQARARAPRRARRLRAEHAARSSRRPSSARGGRAAGRRRRRRRRRRRGGACRGRDDGDGGRAGAAASLLAPVVLLI
eukprot:1350094-Prymnesium_polylepis.1